MKTPKYSHKQATCLIPLLEGIATEIKERRAAISMLEKMIASLAASSNLHADEILIRKRELYHERVELRRIGREMDLLGCSLTLLDPLEIFIPGIDSGFAWRYAEPFLRACLIEPFAA